MRLRRRCVFFYDEDNELAQSAGSGFVWDSAGHVITNNHVVEGARRLFVQLDAGQPIEAPPGIEESPGNGGLEGLAVLADGRLLALGESLPPALGPASRAFLRAQARAAIRAAREGQLSGISQ